jgi:hypothetical protein
MVTRNNRSIGESNGVFVGVDSVEVMDEFYSGKIDLWFFCAINV